MDIGFHDALSESAMTLVSSRIHDIGILDIGFHRLPFRPEGCQPTTATSSLRSTTAAPRRT